MSKDKYQRKSNQPDEHDRINDEFARRIMRQVDYNRNAKFRKKKAKSFFDRLLGKKKKK